LALASLLFCQGCQLLSIDRSNPRRCVFIFKSPDPLLISEWQEGKTNVNALAFYNAHQALKKKIFQGVR
jgi:hypothetical protein